MGLVTKYSPEKGDLEDYRLLTDILVSFASTVVSIDVQFCKIPLHPFCNIIFTHLILEHTLLDILVVLSSVLSCSCLHLKKSIKCLVMLILCNYSVVT